MANYRFNIPASGCTDKVIGSYPASDSGKITNFRFGEGIWNDVSISSAETGDAIEIYLKVGEYTETTSGRSIEDIDLFYDIVDKDNPSSILETCSVSVELCQPNKHVLPDNPPGKIVAKAVMTMESGPIQINCGKNPSPLTKAELEDERVVIGDVINAKFGSCVTEFSNFTFNGNENLTACTFADDIAIDSIPGSFFKGTKIKTLKIPSGVTSGGSEMCSDCYELTSYTVPNDSVMTTLGGKAFNNCFKLESAVLPSGITKINDRTFNQCRSLRSITIPDNVTLIDDWAFCMCSGLTEATISDGTPITKFGVQSFRECKSLRSINIPNTTEYIGTGAFVNCEAMTAATIQNTSDSPSVLKTISDNAFNSCKALKKMDFPKTLETIGNSAFNECTSLTAATFENGSVLDSIGDSAFENCSALKSITIPYTTTVIEKDAFMNCTTMTSFTMSNSTANPSQLTTIGENAFRNCSSATNDLIIHNKVTSLGKAAFMECKSAPRIVFNTPIQITIIPQNCFNNCISLSTINIPNTIVEIDNSAYYYCSGATSLTFEATSKVVRIGSNAFNWCSSINSVTIPNTVETIDSNAFAQCTSLTSVTFGSSSSLKTIGSWAFNQCRIKGNLVLPEGLETIDIYAFGFNADYSGSENNLTGITMPSTIAEIGYGAFHASYKLKTATIKAVTPPNFIPNPLPDVTDAWIFEDTIEQIYVPSGSVALYKAKDYLQNVKDKISAI